MKKRFKKRFTKKIKLKIKQLTFKIKKARYQKLAKTSNLTKRSVLIDKKGNIKSKKIAEITKILNDRGIIISQQDVVDFARSKYYEKDNSVKVYSVLNKFDQLQNTNLVQFFLQNMDIDIDDLAGRLEVNTSWLLNENNWDWKLNKNGQRVTPTRLHTTPKGKNVTFDWCYGGGTIINVQ